MRETSIDKIDRALRGDQPSKFKMEMPALALAPIGARPPAILSGERRRQSVQCAGKQGVRCRAQGRTRASRPCFRSGRQTPCPLCLSARKRTARFSRQEKAGQGQGEARPDGGSEAGRDPIQGAVSSEVAVNQSGQNQRRQRRSEAGVGVKRTCPSAKITVSQGGGEPRGRSARERGAGCFTTMRDRGLKRGHPREREAALRCRLGSIGSNLRAPGWDD